jgi:hypothetical protein
VREWPSWMNIIASSEQQFSKSNVVRIILLDVGEDIYINKIDVLHMTVVRFWCIRLQPKKRRKSR